MNLWRSLGDGVHLRISHRKSLKNNILTVAKPVGNFLRLSSVGTGFNMARQRDYLFKRKGSQNWWVRFQYTGELAELLGRKEERSLGTPDKAEAEVKALPLIHAHKLLLLTMKNKQQGILSTKTVSQYEPNREHFTPDGERVIATKEQLIFLDSSGKVQRIEPNRPHVQMVLKTDPSEMRELRRYRPKKLSSDDALIQAWIDHQNISGFLEREARTTWETFKALVNNKPLKDCSRDDARKLSKHLFEQGNKSATVAKKCGHLRAAVNLAIEENRLTFNPFSGALKPTDDALDKLPLDDDDMGLVRTCFDELGPEERSLWLWLANTGMRRGEPFQIREEFREAGVRYVIVGTKTDQSLRRVPIPNAVISLIPAKITSPLFQGSPKNLGRSLNRFMRKVGIDDKRKTLHCLRHRAKDRLRAAGCPLDVQYHLLGHEQETVAAGYGVGYPVPKLKEWMETIGW